MTDLHARAPGAGLVQRTLELQGAADGSPSPEALPWFRGALGEIIIAGRLTALGEGWTVLHSVPVGETETDIDHLLIGPPGVFTVNTKYSPGRPVWIGGRGLLVGGHRTDYIRKAAAEAGRAGRVLSSASGLTVEARPLLVFVEPGRITLKAAPDDGVQVLDDAALVPMLLAARREFSDEQVQRIARAAARPSTWRTSAFDPELDPLIARRFQAMLARQAGTAAPPARRSGEPIGRRATVRASRGGRLPALIGLVATIALLLNAPAVAQFVATALMP